MKTRTWITLLAALLALCILLSVLIFLPQGTAAARAEIYSQGKLIATLDLNEDQQITVISDYGTNVVTVLAGSVAVTHADCPDGYCVQRGFCSGGTEIVCLPNRLVIRFVGTGGIDAVAG